MILIILKLKINFEYLYFFIVKDKKFDHISFFFYYFKLEKLYKQLIA